MSTASTGLNPNFSAVKLTLTLRSRLAVRIYDNSRIQIRIINRKTNRLPTSTARLIIHTVQITFSTVNMTVPKIGLLYHGRVPRNHKLKSSTTTVITNLTTTHTLTVANPRLSSLTLLGLTAQVRNRPSGITTALVNNFALT